MSITISTRRAAHAAGWLALVAVVVVPILIMADPAAALAGPAGDVRVTTPGGSALGVSGSETAFAVSVPAGATCPGDTAHDFYLVDSYLVPQGTSPATVDFRGGIPNRGFGIFSDGAYFGAVNTARDTGTIFILPTAASWARLTAAQLLPHGTRRAVWETGLACADRNGVPRRYWNTQVTFTRDARDPNGYHWTVAVPPDPHRSDRTAILVLLLLVAAVAASVLVLSQSRRTTPAHGRAR